MLDRDSKAHKIAENAMAILFWVAIWFCAAFAVDNSILLAGPIETIQAIFEEFGSTEFWAAVLQTFTRIMGAAVISAIVGALLGVLASYAAWVKVLLAPAMQVLKSAPVACVVVILLVVLGSRGAIVAIVVFVALPPFYVAALEVRQLAGNDTAEVLRIMGANRISVFLASTWPAVLPFFQNAAKTSFALAWRAGIMGELLGIPLGSVGAAIYSSKLTLDTPALLAWTIIVMLLAWGCEKAVVWFLGLTAKTPKLSLHVGKLPNASTKSEELILEEISKAYDSKVLENVTLALRPGSRICLMAPTGTGKSTFIRIALGMETPDSGDVEYPRICAVVLQQNTLITALSAVENVALTSRLPIEEIARELSDLLPPGTSNKRVEALSGGTKRLTEIARAMLSEGKAVLMDEPFAGLDEKTKEKACCFIREKLHDRPLLIATHSIEDAQLLDANILHI